MIKKISLLFVILSLSTQCFAAKGDHYEASIKKYGSPKGTMVSDSTAALIFETPTGQITEKYNKQGICTESIFIRDKTTRPIKQITPTKIQPATSIENSINEITSMLAPLVILILLFSGIITVFKLVILRKIAKKKKTIASAVWEKITETTDTRPPTQRAHKYRYERQKYLFTKTEMSFLHTLQKAIGNEFKIMGKVRLSDVITPNSPNNRSTWQKAFNSITCKHLDFVLCDSETYEIKFAIELDDPSHQRKDRIKRDDFLNSAMQSAGVPLYRFKTQKNYNIPEIRTAIGLKPQQKHPDTRWMPEP